MPYSPDRPGAQNIAEARLKLMAQLAKSWDYRLEPPRIDGSQPLEMS